jgi:hypothetical protein
MGFSRIVVTKKDSLLKLIDYIYQDKEFKSLLRKEKIAIEIKNITIKQNNR